MLFDKSLTKKYLTGIIPVILIMAVCFTGCKSGQPVEVSEKKIVVDTDALQEHPKDNGIQIEVENKIGNGPDTEKTEADETGDIFPEENGSEEEGSEENKTEEESLDEEGSEEEEPAGEEPVKTEVTPGSIEEISIDPGWQYAGNSKINSGTARLYRAAENRKNIIVGVNAGHGTKGGQSVKTYCHPDMSPKVTGGSTASGSVTAAAVSGGMTFADGAKEAQVTLDTSKILRDKLLAQGYDVLMLRDDTDVQLDNIARTVIANNVANCIISLHWDGDNLGYDKGCFYISTPDGIKNMEPVSQHWQEHERLGQSLIEGLKSKGCKINGNGKMSIDLTQTSYSTIPSIDIELGNQASAHDNATLSVLADGLLAGIGRFFGTN